MGFGEWIKLADGTFIEAGSTIKDTPAGLPNIKGVLNGLAFDAEPGKGSSVDGAFERKDFNYFTKNCSGDQFLKTYNTTFDATKGEIHNDRYSNIIYGKSDTVQPKSRTAYIYYRKN